MRLLFWSSCLAIFYTLLGYPLAVALLARLMPRPWRREALTPRVSLIIAAHNEANWIGRKLENSLALEYPQDRLEILVAEDGSTDSTPAIVRSFAERGVKLIQSPFRQGKAATISLAAECASGEVLVFTDANVLYAPDALRQLVANFADPRVAVVGGTRRVVGEHRTFGRAETLYWRYEDWIRANESLVGQTTAINGELLAVRRADWQPLPSGTLNDDLVIALRAMVKGRRVVFEPRAHAMETTTASATDELIRRRRWLAGRWQALAVARQLSRPLRPLALWEFASHKGMRALLPLFAISAALSNLILALTGRSRGSLLGRLEQLAFAGQVTLATLVAARATGLPLPAPLSKFASVAAYIVIGQFGALAGFWAWLRGRQSAAWTKAARQMSATGGTGQSA